MSVTTDSLELDIETLRFYAKWCEIHKQYFPNDYPHIKFAAMADRLESLVRYLGTVDRLLEQLSET